MMPTVHCLLLSLLIFSLGLLPSPGRAQDLPIFDAHIHYNRPDWDVYPSQAILKIMERAGIRHALVSSTPDDGTLKLFDKDPKRIVPFLRPYRTSEDPFTWYKDPTIPAYLERRLKRQVYKGIGEFHISQGETDTSVIRWLVDTSVHKGLFLHAHTDDAAIVELFALRPEVKILWAHAGISVPAQTVGKLLERYPNLWIELSLREDVAPGGELAPAWRALFLRNSDRVMVGTDTWATSRWEEVIGTLKDVRFWLRLLPGEVAEKIAYKNAERIFGIR